MSTAVGVRELNRRIGVPGRLAIVLLLIALIACVLSLRGLVRSLLAPSAQAVKSIHEEKTKQLTEDYAKVLTQHTAQFTGRSVFFVPSPPPPPRQPEPEVKVVEAPPPPPPPPPATYGGPKLIAMINDEAWFEDGQKLKAGESGKGDLKIKELRPPWDVAVVWKGIEFSVSLFDRDRVVYPPPTSAKPETNSAASVPTVPEAKASPVATAVGTTGTPAEPAAAPSAPKDEPKVEPAPASEPKPEAAPAGDGAAPLPQTPERIEGNE